MPMARPSSWPLNVWVSSEVPAGPLPDSPMPTPMRARKKVQKPVASPQHAVIRLHEAIESEMISGRLMRSASQASGRPQTT